MTIELRAHEVNNTSVRKVERASIREFVTSCQSYLSGRVLDYGCGLQPYRDVVEAAGGTYEGYDRAAFPANISVEDVDPASPLGHGDAHDAVLCTQVAQYWPEPAYSLGILHSLVRPGGHLILTYPTTWAEVEPEDLTRFTRTGMDRLLRDIVGFTIVRHEQRAVIDLGGFRLPLGYGVLARA